MDDILINSVEKRDALYSSIYRNIRELGVKLPKIKKVNKLNQSRRSFSVSGQQDENSSGKIFGESLFVIPTSYIPDYGYVPEFLVESCEIIDRHLECEGIFRKSGSLSRQKELRLAVDEGKPLDGANVFDTAVLIKQFFRELPEPLFLTVYLDAFIRCYQLPPDKDSKKAILQLCLLLPLENIGALRYIMHMLSRVAAVCDKNKMTANNLALIMAPNIMHNNKGTQKMSSSEEKLLHIQTYIVELLIKNWDHIGMVNQPLQQQMGVISEYTGTDDDLDASDDNTLEDSKDVSKKVRRKRSGSLTDLVSSIAHGLAKLRRSTDGGKGGNMSLNSSQKGEVSIVSSQSSNQFQDIPADAVTPCVMRKRRASGDNVPFSTSKKQAILGNLPQKSALASTPFTPSSTVRKNQDNKQTTLNATTPAMGSKTARKKLSLFISPGSKTKVKGQTSTSTTSESPPALRNKPTKSKNIFKRLSGSRAEKVTNRSGEFLPDDALPRSVSSPTLLDKDYRCNLVPSMSLVSSASCDTTTSLQSLLSTDSLLSLESRMSHDMSQSAPAINESPDSGKGSMLGEASYDFTVPSQFISQQGDSQTNGHDEGVWVNCRTSVPDKSIVNNDQALDQSHGLALLCENYTTTSDEDDSADQRIQNKIHVSLDLVGVNPAPKRTNISRKKSVSAEDLQSAQLKVTLPIRVQSLGAIPSKSYNFKPHLQISKQTHNLLARAGYFRSTDSEAKDVQVPVKSPKRSSYREEMMNSLRSSFHERHAHSNISFRSLRDFHNSSLYKDKNIRSSSRDSSSVHKCAPRLDVCAGKSLSPLSEERHFHLPQRDVTEAEVDVTGLDVSGLGCSAPDVVMDVTNNVTDIEVDVTNNVTDIEVDVTNNVTDIEVDVTNNVTDIEVDVTNNVTDIEVDVTNNVTDIEVDVTADASDFGVNVTHNRTNTEVNVADYTTNIVVDVTSLEESVAADIALDSKKTDQNVDSQVHSDETGHVSVPKHNVKDIKAALTLSGILDEEIINQVKIKRAEVLFQKRDSVVNVQHAGLVSQSIRQFSQHINTECDKKPIKPLVPKRGTSPLRIPTIFTKNHDTKSPAKDSNANIQSAAFPVENIHEKPMVQAVVKTPLRLLQPTPLKPLQTPSSARNQRPHIKRLRVQYSPRKINHRSPKLNSVVKSPSGPM